ncbi:MraY family glycosyltransferase [soil metagenome]
MRMIYYLAAGGAAAVITFVLSVALTKLGMRFKLYPKIRERDVHKRPTPRLGGIAMFLGIVAVFGIASQVPQFHLIFADPGPVLAILGSALFIVLIGVADDIWDLDWFTKLAGQLIAAGLLAWQGVQLTSLPTVGGVLILSPYAGLVITVLAIVLVMNATNFIDGLDGLVAGVTVIANGVFFLYSYQLATNIAQTEYFNLASLITAVLIGACVGFLPLNWHPAKLFMGDSGSMLVGLLMATSAISVTGQLDFSVMGGRQLLPAFIPIILPFAIFIVPLLDFALAVIRRLRAGKSPFSADRKHLHHRLLDMGHSDVHAVLIFYSWTTVVAVGCLLFLFVPTVWAVLFVVVGLLVCTVYTLAPLSRRKAVEVAVQAVDAGSPELAAAARLDPLDVAANSTDPDDDRQDPAERAAVEALIAPADPTEQITAERNGTLP